MQRKYSFLTKSRFIVVLTVLIWVPDNYVNALSELSSATRLKNDTPVSNHTPYTRNRTVDNGQHNITPKRNTLTRLEISTKTFPPKQKRDLHQRTRSNNSHKKLHATTNRTISKFSQEKLSNVNKTLLKTNRGKRKADPQLPYGATRSEMDPLVAARRFLTTNQAGYPSHSSPQVSSNGFIQEPLLHDSISPFEGERRGGGHMALRTRLLDALARRIQERNMYIREHGIIPDRERQLLEFQRNRENFYPRHRDPLLLERTRLGGMVPIENGLHEQNTVVPFRERLLEANGMRSLHHHQPIIDSRLLTGELTPEEPLLSNRRMFANVGNLGDETMPYGSLGESKPSEYIPVGRVGNLQTMDQDNVINQELANEELTEFVPSLRPHKQKKTWVTDVNVYSKKKNEDINSLLNDNDNDPLDEYVRNRCHPNPCMHGSKCTETNTGFQCSCVVGFKGKRCQARNYCLPNPCMNEAVCSESSSTDGFSCTCKDGYYGRICDQKRTACTPSPCQNHGHCFTDGTDAFECVCQTGTSGKLCEIGKLDDSFQSIAHLFNGDNDGVGNTAVMKSIISTPSGYDVSKSFICEANPCLNGGICKKDVSQTKGYQCQCSAEYHGVICEERKCQCENGGTCIGEGIEVRCVCKSGYGGNECQEHTQCNEDTCLHGGICIEQVGGFHCKCDNGYKGHRCEEYDKCNPNPCLHGGICRDYGDFHKCECRKGFKGKQCEDIDLCQPNPCHNGGQCFGYPGGYQCECMQGYKGKTCDQRIHCLSNPCSNGAECIEVPPTAEKPSGSYKCGCKSGFTGETCEEREFCYSSPCHNGGTCLNSKDTFSCKCHEKNYGNHCEHINHCYGNPCKNNGKCVSGIHDFKCECIVGFKGTLCEEADFCQPNPCKNAGFCAANIPGTGFNCQCKEGFRGLTCTDHDPCAPNPCSHGQCVELAGGYICNCTVGFKGTKCTEINHCEPNPCFHGGTCEEINGGIGYVCQCSPGYKGEMCEKKDLCNPNPCQNNGECSDNTFAYGGMSKYTSQANAQDAIHCTCSKGFRGDRCKEVDPCFPNVCKHNSQCIADGHSPLKCNCSIGWKGQFCDSVDLCSPDPCRYGTHCIQTDEESYQCGKNLCTPNPCTNNGKCIVVNDESFECACPKGWRGLHCEEQDSCVPNPCENGGICHDMENGGYTCECPKKFAGNKCQIAESAEAAKDYCEAYPCKNGGTCIDTEGGFTCRCNQGFSGPFCEDSVCHPMPCDNGGTCVPYYGIALCKCKPEFTGAHCSESRKPATVQHSDINTIKMTELTGKTSPKPSNTELLKHSGGNTPLLVERVEEILNSDRDKTDQISPSKIEDILKPVNPMTSQKEAIDSKSQLSNQPPPVPPEPPTTIPVDTKMQNLPTPTALAVSKTSGKMETMEVPTPTGSVFRPVVVIRTQDPCEPNTCLHGGICVVRSNGEPECICPHGFSGPMCKEIGLLGYSSAPKFFPNDECKHCDRNAICVNGHCICEQNYVGDGLECWPSSQEDKDWLCDTSPCQNGGTCKPGRAKCVCKLGYIGKYCERYCPPSVHLSFDTMKGPYVKDESGNNNNAVLRNGAEITYDGGKCDSGASLQGGDILFDGRNFQPKPVDSVTMAVWVKVDTSRGIQSLFDTVGGERSTHREGQYHLEIDNARIRWFHRNEHHVTIFSVLSEPLLVEGNWTHITGTYSGEQRIAKLFVNGDLVGFNANTSDVVHLSQDWDTKAGIGKHEHPFGNRLLRGMVDEFFIFACPLPRLEILVLMHHCKIYWKHNEESASPSSKHEVASAIKTVDTLGDASALRKAKERYQNYVGYETELKVPVIVKESDRAMAFTNKPVAEQITVTGNQRYHIAKPLLPIISEPRTFVNRPGQLSPFMQYTKPSADVNFMGIPNKPSSLPNGRSQLYNEVREMIAREGLLPQNKRTQISAMQQLQNLDKKLVMKINPNGRPRYHHAPIVRNENKELPFGPHAYLNPLNLLTAGMAKSTFPTSPQLNQPSNYNVLKKYATIPEYQPKNNVNIAGPSAFFGPDSPPVKAAVRKSPIPNVQNAPVSSSYMPNFDINGLTGSNMIQYQSPSMLQQHADPRMFVWSKGLAHTSGGTHTNTHTNTLQRNDPGVAKVGTNVKSSQNSGGKTNQQQSNRFNIPLQNIAIINTYGNAPLNNLNLNSQLDGNDRQRYQQPKQVAMKKQIHTETHGHQWGFGNGNGNGNGVGKPGGSGSGGGWGAGGPLQQSVSLPGWGGNPPDGPPWGDKAKEKQKENQQSQSFISFGMQPNQQQKSFVIQNIQQSPTFPVNAREVWNSYVAQKKQSTSEMHADSTNTVSSSAQINPINPQALKVQNHGWGYGNGNGQAGGAGPGGGTGDAGGWGAGGPVKQETRLPGQQKSFIHNPSFPFAIAQSLKAPWVSGSPSNNDKPQTKVNSFHFPQVPDFDKRTQMSSPRQQFVIPNVSIRSKIPLDQLPTSSVINNQFGVVANAPVKHNIPTNGVFATQPVITKSVIQTGTNNEQKQFPQTQPSFVSALKEEALQNISPSQNRGGMTGLVNPASATLLLPESVRRQIISQAIADAMHGLKKKKKRKRRYSKEKRRINDVG